MRWPAFLFRRRPRPMSAERLQALEASIDAALAKRKAGRRSRSARSRKGAATRVHVAFVSDPLVSALGIDPSAG